MCVQRAESRQGNLLQIIDRELQIHIGYHKHEMMRIKKKN